MHLIILTYTIINVHLSKLSLEEGFPDSWLPLLPGIFYITCPLYPDYRLFWCIWPFVYCSAAWEFAMISYLKDAENSEDILKIDHSIKILSYFYVLFALCPRLYTTMNTITRSFHFSWLSLIRLAFYNSTINIMKKGRTYIHTNKSIRPINHCIETPTHRKNEILNFALVLRIVLHSFSMEMIWRCLQKCLLDGGSCPKVRLSIKFSVRCCHLYDKYELRIFRGR